MAAEGGPPITLDLDADVIVVGGGPAGGWAAIGAARAGASVILADKGYHGASGVMATAGVGHWWVAPDDRDAAVAARAEAGLGLGDPRWMRRILEQTWETLPGLRGVYAFPVDDNGITRYRSLRGPEYGRALRRLVKRSGVRVLDHSPALELLVHADGSVAGVQGERRQPHGRWRVRAGAVVLATGGTSFKSFLLGSHTNTGDGQLMAAEAGAELSGMEFSSYYTLSPAFSTMTRSMAYNFGHYSRADGTEIDLPDNRMAWNAILARELMAGPVFTVLSDMPESVRAGMPAIQPNFMLPFDRMGIDPYSDRFEVKLRPEGTIRGTGGLRITTDDCRTTVPGLFAAGDAASRELVAGATSGGGAQNSAWAMSSGTWAGRGAAAFARAAGDRVDRAARPMGGAGLRPSDRHRDLDTRALLTTIQNEMHPLEKNYFRSGDRLTASLDVLEQTWRDVRSHLAGTDALTPAREIASMCAVARWCYSSALARTESRGMHRREDMPERDPQLETRFHVGGLDAVWVRPESSVLSGVGA
jgi:succinate dehydrogenase/fumarate reductase flavoprotein subunit